MAQSPTLHDIFDRHYGPAGDTSLRALLAAGADPNEPAEPLRETPLHVGGASVAVRSCSIMEPMFAALSG